MPLRKILRISYTRVCSEHYRLLASLWKGQVLQAEVLRAPGPVEFWGRPPSCHRCRTTSTIWLEQTRRSSKNHLAENNWGGLTVTEFRGSHGMEEGKGERYLASGRQYGNAPPRRSATATVPEEPQPECINFFINFFIIFGVLPYNTYPNRYLWIERRNVCNTDRSTWRCGCQSKLPHTEDIVDAGMWHHTWKCGFQEMIEIEFVRKWHIQWVSRNRSGYLDDRRAPYTWK